jgi:hypothetical protein
MDQLILLLLFFGKFTTRAADDPPVLQVRILSGSRLRQFEQRNRAPAGSGKKSTSRCALCPQRWHSMNRVFAPRAMRRTLRLSRSRTASPARAYCTYIRSAGYAGILAAAKNSEEKVEVSQEEYLKHYLENYVGNYQVRSAQALAAIGGADARKHLAAAVSRKTLREDVQADLGKPQGGARRRAPHLPPSDNKPESVFKWLGFLAGSPMSREKTPGH